MLRDDAVTSSHPPWRPYEDDPLFVPEVLTGFHTMASGDAQRLTRYLSELVAQRGTVHTAVAFNAVYFGYDLSFQGYVGGPVDFDSFPQLASQEVTEALPIGAMVTVRTGSAPLHAEIVHAEHTGEPEEDGEGAVVCPERLVCDTDAFSPGTVVSTTHLDRLRAHNRWIDSAGHLVHRARHAAPAAVERGDRKRFVEYLLGPGRAQLMAGPLPLLLTNGAGQEQFAAALHMALDTVAQALAAAGSVRLWRDYAFTRRGLRQRLEEDGPLGRSDMDWLVKSVVRPNLGRDGHPRTRHTEVGTFLRSLSRTEYALAGTGYLHALAHANALIADHISEHGRGGLMPGGTRVRLTDPHREGGLWSAEPAPAPEAPDSNTPERKAPHARVETIDPSTDPGRSWLPPASDLAEYVAEHDVAPFLRRLPEGQRASVTARAEYHRLLSRFGARRDLPSGFTLVRGHTRSRRGGPGSAQ